MTRKSRDNRQRLSLTVLTEIRRWTYPARYGGLESLREKSLYTKGICYTLTMMTIYPKIVTRKRAVTDNGFRA